MSPIVLILVVILILSLLGGGYGLRTGNTVLGAGGGLVGLILLVTCPHEWNQCLSPG